MNTEPSTTTDLMQTLGDDVGRLWQQVKLALEKTKGETKGPRVDEYQFQARQYVRAAFAYIEGVTFSVKLWAINNCMTRHIEISDHEIYMAQEIDAVLNNKGEVEQQPAKIRTASNIRFALNLLHRVRNDGKSFDATVAWWSKLKDSIRVRDRLTHPRRPEELHMTYSELLAVMDAVNGLSKYLIDSHPDAITNQGNASPSPSK